MAYHGIIGCPTVGCRDSLDFRTDLNGRLVQACGSCGYTETVHPKTHEPPGRGNTAPPSLVEALERALNKYNLHANGHRDLLVGVVEELKRSGVSYHPLGPGIRFCAVLGCRRRVRGEPGTICWQHADEDHAKKAQS